MDEAMDALRMEAVFAVRHAQEAAAELAGDARREAVVEELWAAAEAIRRAIDVCCAAGARVKEDR